MGLESWARLLEGRVLAGRYAIERLVGEGGMGAVFAATQLAVQRRVAIKVMLPGVAGDASAVERFHREATLVARIARRGVPQIIDFDRDPLAGPFVVMELLVGESLSDRLRRSERLHPRDAGSIAASMLETLEVVHEQGIVHRDLKPANVFLAREGPAERSVKILDFGVARVRAPYGDMTGQGAVLGTPRYMAPEQAAGDRNVDARADLYAVGAVLYVCLGGKPPYAGVTGEDVLAAVVAGPPASLLEAAGDLTPALVAVVDRAMKRSPGARFQTAAEMRAALMASMTELPDAPPASAGPDSRTVSSSRPAGPPLSARATVRDGARSVEPEPRERTEIEARPSTRTPGPAPRSWPSLSLLVAGGLFLAAATFAVIRAKPHGAASTGQPTVAAPATPPAATDDAIPAGLRDQLEKARSAWRSGDAERARPMLEAVVHDVEVTRAHVPSPAARAAAEALLMLGDLDEKAIVGAAPREPTTALDMGPAAFVETIKLGMRATNDYLRTGVWGEIDLVSCAQYRSGRVQEKLGALARAAEARDLEMVQRPAIQELYYPGGAAEVRAVWASTVSSFRTNAIAYYDGAVMQAQFFGGAIADPEDGLDCRAAALSRRDTLKAEGDAAP
jgi:eukaryotic-like serine/threonine-protein kinase